MSRCRDNKMYTSLPLIEVVSKNGNPLSSHNKTHRYNFKTNFDFEAKSTRVVGVNKF